MSSRKMQRIPPSLQIVFVGAANGLEIETPPPGREASRSFGRRMIISRERNVSLGGFIEKNKQVMKRDESFDTQSTMSGSISERSNSRWGSDSNLQSSSSRKLSCGRTARRSTGKLERPGVTRTFSTNLDPAFRIAVAQTYSVSVQAYVTSIVKTRGYSADRYCALKTAYFNKPTKLQIRSYGIKLAEAIEDDNVSDLCELLKAGLSPNACDGHGESIVHLACCLGRQECLAVLLEFGASCQVSDNLGRTPMHSACLSTSSDSPNTDIVNMILKEDRRLLFVEDAQGNVPLECLRKEQWLYWTKHFVAVKEKFWPDRDMVKNGVESTPYLATLEANTKPYPDPLDALPLGLASKVAQGLIRPMEAAICRYTYETSDSDASEED